MQRSEFLEHVLQIKRAPHSLIHWQNCVAFLRTCEIQDKPFAAVARAEAIVRHLLASDEADLMQRLPAEYVRPATSCMIATRRELMQFTTEWEQRNISVPLSATIPSLLLTKSNKMIVDNLVLDKLEGKWVVHVSCGNGMLICTLLVHEFMNT